MLQGKSEIDTPEKTITDVIRERPFDFYGGGGAGRFFEKKFQDNDVNKQNIQDDRTNKKNIQDNV